MIKVTRVFGCVVFYLKVIIDSTSERRISSNNTYTHSLRKKIQNKI